MSYLTLSTEDMFFKVIRFREAVHLLSEAREKNGFLKDDAIRFLELVDDFLNDILGTERGKMLPRIIKVIEKFPLERIPLPRLGLRLPFSGIKLDKAIDRLLSLACVWCSELQLRLEYLIQSDPEHLKKIYESVYNDSERGYALQIIGHHWLRDMIGHPWDKSYYYIIGTKDVDALSRIPRGDILEVSMAEIKSAFKPKKHKKNLVQTVKEVDRNSKEYVKNERSLSGYEISQLALVSFNELDKDEVQQEIRDSTDIENIGVKDIKIYDINEIIQQCTKHIKTGNHFLRALKALKVPKLLQ